MSNIKGGFNSYTYIAVFITSFDKFQTANYGVLIPPALNLLIN